MMETNDAALRMAKSKAEPAPQSFVGKVQGANDSPCHDCEQWTTLGRFVNVLAVADLATKARILKNLSPFLLSSAATFSHPSPASTQDISVLAVVGSRRVCIKYDDVLDLHDTLFRELAHHTPSFFADSETGTGSYNTFPSTSLEIKVTSLTLRCCIRLLPLIELFDTGLRNGAGVALDRLLQKLCSPMEPCLRRGSECTSDESSLQVGPHRGPTLCAMLEVYIDELLSQPKTQFLLLQDETLEKEIRITERITLEATLAHVMISVHAPTQPHGFRARASELSLQSAVMSLDRAITDKMPRYLLSHVINMVSQALEEDMTTPEDFTPVIETDHPKKWFSKFTYLGCFRNLAGSIDINVGLDTLSQQVRFCFVSSVLERAVSLYMKFAAAPHLANFVETPKDDQQRSAILSTSLLGSCLWNYVNFRGLMSQKCEAALESMLNDATLRKGLEESIDQTCCYGHGYVPGPESGHRSNHGCRPGNIERLSGTHVCGMELHSGSIWEEDHSTLVADILHLMHSALDFVMEKAQMVRQEPEDCPASDMTGEHIDNTLLGLIGAFHECMPSTGDVMAPESVGRVLVFFTEMLYYEAETTISETRLREYLELLESLLISLLMEDKWRRKSSTFCQAGKLLHRENEWLDVDTCRTERDGSRIPPGSYAREVVGLLQGFLEEPELLEILGEGAVSVILQINSFLNDFCEFMDNVLSTRAWRESIPANGRRIMKQPPAVSQREIDLIDRDVRAGTHDYEDGPWETERSPGDERQHAEDQPCPKNAWLEGRQLRPLTLPILQKLTKQQTRPTKPHDPSPERSPERPPERSPPPEEAAGKRKESRPIRKCRQVLAAEAAEPLAEADGNQFVAEVLLLEKTSSRENFDDLKDFIVCKRGRSYTKWLNRRTKFRRRKRTREIWKRTEHKRKLLSMLDIV